MSAIIVLRLRVLAAGALLALAAWACASPTPTPMPTVAPAPILTPTPAFTPSPMPTPTPTFTPTLTPTPTFTPIPTPTPTPTFTPTLIPTPTFAFSPRPTATLAPAQWPTPWPPPPPETPVPDGEPTACWFHPLIPPGFPHPERFVHWITTEVGDYLVFDYQQNRIGFNASDSIGKLSLDTEIVETIINASPYRWRFSLHLDPSPSEPLIAYTSCEFVTNYTSNHDPEIAIVDWTTLDRIRLTDNASYDFFPVWSPDGKRIVFLSWLGVRGGSLWNFASNSVVINVTNAKGELRTSSRGALLYPVAWSPNSEEFAFINAINVDSDAGYGEIVEIGVFLTGIDKIEPRQIASATSYETSGVPRKTRLNSITFGGPSWSPDGRDLAFGSSDYDSVSVHLISRDGTNDRVIWEGDSARPISQVTWSPDGEEILFIADAAYVVRPDGSGLRRLELPLKADFSYMRAAWSPDSSRIAFYDGWDGIVTMNRNGAGVRIYETP